MGTRASRSPRSRFVTTFREAVTRPHFVRVFTTILPDSLAGGVGAYKVSPR